MERSPEGAGFSRVERATNERRRWSLLEGSGRGSGFCIVSMATPPDVLSNYHLVPLPLPLPPPPPPPHATPSRRHSETSARPPARPPAPSPSHDAHSGAPETSERKDSAKLRIQSDGHFRRLFPTTCGSRPRILSLHALASTYARRTRVPRTRRVARKHLIYYSGK